MEVRRSTIVSFLSLLICGVAPVGGVPVMLKKITVLLILGFAIAAGITAVMAVYPGQAAADASMAWL
jgi:hypothetical protein